MPDEQTSHLIIPITIWTGVISSALMVVGILGSYLTFGEGAGDTFYMMFFTLAAIGTAGGHFFLKNKVNADHPIHALLTVLMLVYTCVMLGFLTYWRGGSYPWNGEMFLG